MEISSDIMLVFFSNIFIQKEKNRWNNVTFAKKGQLQNAYITYGLMAQ